MEHFDVVILGGGAGAKLIWGSVPGRSVAVVEQSRVGGACPFVACVPSKAMLHTARVWQTAADPQFTGLFAGRRSGETAYRIACERRDAIVHHRDDTLNATKLTQAGATLIRGHGYLREPGVIEVDGRRIGYRDLVINTGSAVNYPAIRGLDPAKVWTSDDALSTTEQPRSLLILGGGAVGCELAFLFATFGTAVSLVQRGPRLLSGEEPRAAQTVHRALNALGVDVHTGVEVTNLTWIGDAAHATTSDDQNVSAERVVVATGRVPRSGGLGLDNLGLDVIAGQAVATDERCRVVGASHVWAIGDVTGVAAFTHTSHYQGRVVAANLRGEPVAASYTSIPRAVYVEPTLAAVGHTVASARAAGIEPRVATAEMSEAVRSVTDGAPHGWLMLLADPVANTVLGATAMGRAAEEWMSVVSLAIRAQIPIDVLTDVVHPFPSFGELLEGPLWELATKRAGAAI
jgi:pyruvate/2-oxoglutarate dehydrogenase complex dihydrolipoamide dehydrogenase (E3) component